MRLARNSCWALLALATMSACEMRREKQENYLIDASQIGGEALAQNLAHRLGIKASSEPLATAPGDVRIYRMESRDLFLIIVPLPDNRCDPNAVDATYDGKMFRLDLVYKRGEADQQKELREKVESRLRDLKVPVEPFSECS